MNAHTDLTGLAVVVLAAVLCGGIMSRLRQPAIVGYILAGILLGPSALGLVENRGLIEILADLGVLLLLFLVGMELSLEGLKGVWRKAVTATSLQILASVGATLLLSLVFDWPLGLAILLGFVIALSSTAIVIKMLEGMNILKTHLGLVTVGVLIVQDLAFIPMMLVVGALAGETFGAAEISKIVVSVAILFGLVYYLSRREKVTLPFAGLVEGHRDLTPLRGLAFCFGSATLTGLLGLSPAYGAFLAGLMIGNSTERRAMLRSVQPIESILMMVFFLSIGLLIDLAFIWEHIGTVLMILFMVTVFKTALNIGVLRLSGEPWPHAFISGILLAQIGEFSFLLGRNGVSTGLISPGDGDLIVTVTALSLVISPLWLATARRLLRFVIAGVTSGHEALRLLFGRHAPAVFKTWDALAGSASARSASRFAASVLSRLPRRASGKAKDDAGIAAAADAENPKVVDVAWEEVPSEGPPEPPPDGGKGKRRPRRNGGNA